jgi:ParB family chromosome partitioning protein
MPPRKTRAPAKSVGITAAEAGLGTPPREVQELEAQVRTDGGAVLGRYREPLAGAWVLFVSLPLDKVEPTPYQREPSPTHVARLAGVIPKVGRFLDPVIATRHDDGYWTPNGMHRLLALRQLGARAITALLVPEPEIAYRILALNTEKAHNLKDKSLEAVRMARGLAEIGADGKRAEQDWAFELEEPAYLTIGMCYEQNPRFSGGAYLPIVKRTDEFSSQPIAKSLAAREARARKLLVLDEAVNEAVARLKDAGFKSAYLKPFVVARINPLRFVRPTKPGQKSPRADFDATVDKMLASAKKLDVSKIKPQDIAATGGPAMSEE